MTLNYELLRAIIPLMDRGRSDRSGRSIWACKERSVWPWGKKKGGLAPSPCACLQAVYWASATYKAVQVRVPLRVLAQRGTGPALCVAVGRVPVVPKPVRVAVS